MGEAKIEKFFKGSVQFLKLCYYSNNLVSLNTYLVLRNLKLKPQNLQNAIEYVEHALVGCINYYSMGK